MSDKKQLSKLEENGWRLISVSDLGSACVYSKNLGVRFLFVDVEKGSVIPYCRTYDDNGLFFKGMTIGTLTVDDMTLFTKAIKDGTVKQEMEEWRSKGCV